MYGRRGDGKGDEGGRGRAPGGYWGGGQKRPPRGQREAAKDGCYGDAETGTGAVG